MKEAIDFIKKGFNTNNPVDVYKYLCIQEGSIQCNNGIYCMSAPISLSDTMKPEGKTFFKAIARCEEGMTISVTSSSEIKIKSGRFSAKINCYAGIYPRLVPEGQVIEQEFDIGAELKDLLPFTQEDNDHLWANGILLNGQTAICTNNIVIVEKWLPFLFPYKVNIPAPTTKALVGVSETVKKIRVTGNRVTFYFEGDRWLSTSLIVQEFPDVSGMLNAESKCLPFSDELAEAVRSLKDKKSLLTFNNNKVSDGKLSYDIPEVDVKGTFGAENLDKVLNIAASIDLNCSPKNSIFYGNNLRGAISGVLR